MLRGCSSQAMARHDARGPSKGARYISSPEPEELVSFGSARLSSRPAEWFCPERLRLISQVSSFWHAGGGRHAFVERAWPGGTRYLSWRR